MAKMEDIKINITANVTCGSFGHRFVKFDSTRIYCEKCGEFRTAPSTFTYFPQWKWDWTTSPTWTTSGTTTFKSDCTSL